MSSPWPNGAQLAVSLVVNFEEGAELAISRGDERNEAAYEVVDEVRDAIDPCMESHFAYGVREGWPRVRATLSEFAVKATVSACGRAVQTSPSVVAEAASDGHEIAAHGWRWETHAGMDERTEREVIRKTAAIIAATTGQAPRGWHTRSATSANTRRLLVEHGGFTYDSNAYDTDVPTTETSGQHRHVIIPYAFDTNDMRFLNHGGFVFAEDFARYCIAAFDRLYAEGAKTPRVLSIGLHLRIIGRPARIDGLRQFLAHATSRSGVWFARRDEIAEAWLRSGSA